MLSVFIPVDRCVKENGCLEVENLFISPMRIYFPFLNKTPNLNKQEYHLFYEYKNLQCHHLYIDIDIDVKTLFILYWNLLF